MQWKMSGKYISIYAIIIIQKAIFKDNMHYQYK